MPPVQDTAVDALDLAILRLLQRDAGLPAHAIGGRVGLSSAAVQRRIKRLRAAGVIEALVAQIDPGKVGLPVTVIVHVDIERETLRHIDGFKRLMGECPEVQQCWYTTGLTDFVLVVRVATLAAYEQFTREALVSHDNVARFTSYVVLGEVKRGQAMAF